MKNFIKENKFIIPILVWIILTLVGSTLEFVSANRKQLQLDRQEMAEYYSTMPTPEREGK